MNNLKQTHPHFVRCIIPNEIKTGGVLDSHLVMHQLTCNGVLEGIRICRKGFPNRMIYSEFKQRYSILAPNVIPKEFVDAKKATENILKEISLSEELYRCGTTKVFFKAGTLGQLEDLRDAALSKIIATLQGQIRGFLMKQDYRKMFEQKVALAVLQRNCRKYLSLRNWPWWNLYTKVKPLLSVARQEDEMKKLEDEFKALKEALEKEEKLRKQSEDENLKLNRGENVETIDFLIFVSFLFLEKNDLSDQLETERIKVIETEEHLRRLGNICRVLSFNQSNENFHFLRFLIVTEKADLEQQLKDVEDRLSSEEEKNEELTAKKKKFELDIEQLKKDIDDLRLNLQKAENECRTKENRIRQCQDEIAKQDEMISKLTREKKRLEEENSKINEKFELEEDKSTNLTKVKKKLEENLNELEENFEREKKIRNDLDKQKRKLENELKTSEKNVEDLQKLKIEFEEKLRLKDEENVRLSKENENQENQIKSLNRKLKEFQLKLEQIDEDFENERQTKQKIEKQKNDLIRELNSIKENFDELGRTTSIQNDLNKKRDAELTKLRRDLDEANLQHEMTTTQLKKKHQDAVFGSIFDFFFRSKIRFCFSLRNGRTDRSTSKNENKT